MRVLVTGGAGFIGSHFVKRPFAATGTEVTLRRGSTADLGRPAPRPAYSVLGTERDDTPRLPSWRDGLAAHLDAARETIAR
jgi:dTDP-4-dehydrorhamnose reductase